MDQIRQGRFLIAPFLLFVDLLSGLYLQDRCWLVAEFRALDGPKITALGGLLAAATFPFSFILGGIEDLLLRLVTCRRHGLRWNYEPLPRKPVDVDAIKGTMAF